MTESTRYAAPRHPRYRVVIFEPATGSPRYFTRTERLVTEEGLAWESCQLSDALWQAELCGNTYSGWRTEIQEQTHQWGFWEVLTPLTLLARATKK